jgi:enediyne biosynthesis protein E4
MKYQSSAVFAAVALLGVIARANPPFVFTDVTERAGLTPHLAGALHHGVAWGDFDGDGLLDLFLGNFDKGPMPKYNLDAGIPNRLFRQAAGGRFVHVPMPSIETLGRTSGAVLVDLDNDGDLDLFVGNNTHPALRPKALPSTVEPSALYRNDNGRFINVSRDSGICPPDSWFVRDIGVLDYDGDGLLDLLVVEDKVFRPRARTRLYRNLGNMKFEDVTTKVGLPDDLHGFGIAVGDLNEDGRPDFFIGGAARLFLSQPDGTFKEAGSLRQTFDIQSRNAEEYICGAWLGDIDNDGDLDLLVGTHFIPGRAWVYLNEGLRDGVPQFRNITRELGLPELPNKTPFCQVADFDNDGLPDLYWSAWFAEDGRRTPFICRGLGIKDGLPRFEIPSLEGLDTTGARKNIAPPSGRGMVYYVNGPAVDYDADGRLDFFAGIWPDENSRLFRNETPTPNNWLQVRVQGTRMNRMGIGARVSILADGRPIARDHVHMNGGYSGSHPGIVHFGLGQRQVVDVLVSFPTRQEPLLIRSVKANQRLMVKEP